MNQSIIKITLLSLLCITLANAQEKDSIQKPDEKIKVNKEYDEDGNLIRYDSIYSYSSGNWNLKNEEMDSIMKRFFSDKEPMPFPDAFENPGFTFSDPFFQNFSGIDSVWRQRFKNRHDYFDSIIKRYDPKKEH